MRMLNALDFDGDDRALAVLRACVRGVAAKQGHRVPLLLAALSRDNQLRYPEMVTAGTAYMPPPGIRALTHTHLGSLHVASATCPSPCI